MRWWRRRRRVVVYGNCQASAVAGLLERTPAFAARYEILPVPGVHEATAERVADARAAFAEADLVVTQAVRDGYHGVPLGSDEMMAACRPGTSVVRIPKLYASVFHPFSCYYNGPVSAVPGAMVYGDVRAVALAAGVDAPPDPDGIRRLAAESEARTAAAEAGVDVRVAGVAFTPGRRETAMWTVNHPRRSTLDLVVAGVLEGLDLPAGPPDGEDEPLGSFRAPLEAPVIDALGLTAPASTTWQTSRGPMEVADLIATDARMLADNPDVLAVTQQWQAERLAALWPVTSAGAPQFLV